MEKQMENEKETGSIGFIGGNIRGILWLHGDNGKENRKYSTIMGNITVRVLGLGELAYEASIASVGYCMRRCSRITWNSRNNPGYIGAWATSHSRQFEDVFARLPFPF